MICLLYSAMNFNTCIDSCNHKYNQDTEQFFTPPKVPPRCPCVFIISPLMPAITGLFSVTCSCDFQDWKHIYSMLHFGIISFIYSCLWDSHKSLHVSMVVLFLLLTSSPPHGCVRIGLFNHPFRDIWIVTRFW